MELFDQENRRKLLLQLIPVAEATGHLIKPYQHTDLTVTQKNDNTPVTEADLAAHRHITEYLAQLTPGIPCLSEESPQIMIQGRRDWHVYWLIDPLDGTREFINGGDAYTINIALIINHQPAIGLIHLPSSGETWYANRGDSAYYRDASGKQQIIQTRTLPSVAVVAIGYRRRFHGQLQHLLERLGAHEIIHRASSLKSCLVASARADLYPCFGPTSEWDTAAAQCIVEQAGGRITDMHMQPLSYNRRETLENPPFIVTGDRNYDWSSLLSTC